jgi:hypothetical protein
MKMGLPLTALLAVSVTALAGDGDAKEQPARFRITTKRKDDSVEVKAVNDKAVFAVKSPFGISQAVIERTDDKWPDAVVLRLHLKGLESFWASNGKVTLDVAVSVDKGKAKVRLWRDGKEDAPLDEKSPFWMGVRILTGDGKPAKELPLKDGYFEVALPKAFFEGNPKSITLDWIDFYRYTRHGENWRGCPAGANRHNLHPGIKMSRHHGLRRCASSPSRTRTARR